MRRRPTSVVGAVLAVSAVVLSGCGSDDSDPATTTTQEASTAAGETTLDGVVVWLVVEPEW